MSEKYQLIDSGNFQKLEQVGPYRFVRPSPGAVWAPSREVEEWKEVDATFIRKSDGKGFWKVQNAKISEEWPLIVSGVRFNIRRTNFGHLGLFVEQQDNWGEFTRLVKEGIAQRGEKEYRVLNLFAYTGGATIAAARGGAQVVHLDASKTSNAWAQENGKANGVEELVRWITDDVKSFVDREIRRGRSYHAIILDPPSFGRGTKSQVWKIEEDMVPLLGCLKELLDKDFHFVSLSSHSPGYTPIALKNLLYGICEKQTGEYSCREMRVEDLSGKFLPAGATGLFVRKK